MSITINPTVPLVAAQGVTSDVVLQPGTVINAQVQQLLGNDQVRIAIGGQSLDVVSQVPLQAGQTLQLAVSQAPDGNINLAVVNQQGVPASQPAASPAVANVTSDAVTVTSAIAASATTTAASAPQPQLTVLQALAVSAVAETAATQQTSLAPLFANLGVAASSGSLPALVQQAAAAVLAQRTSLDQSLSGTDIKQAFQSSGLFLEASLAQGVGIVRHARPQGGADRAAPSADICDRKYHGAGLPRNAGAIKRAIGRDNARRGAGERDTGDPCAGAGRWRRGAGAG